MNTAHIMAISPEKRASPSASFNHPRRSSPETSLSLPGYKRRKLGHSPSNEEAVVPPQDLLHRAKSDESGSSQSASRWFDRVNQHVSQSRRDDAPYDDEPPFFMTHQKEHVANARASDASTRLFGGQSRLDSENEDLRGVIDDLTIENKKLKEILRNHRSNRASPGTESQDKLFEVRMHGLPPDKRRELEYLLKNFATSVHTSAPSLTASNSGSVVSSNSLGGNKPKTDSGYVSNSNSGQTSLRNSKKLLSSSGKSKAKSIKSYLHDIPDTLLPRQNPVIMSERAKMALVVRRLEQLFTGKIASPGEHSQPMQQQEVSHLAARADSKSKKRRIDGPREAHILPPDSKVNFDAIDTTKDKPVPSTSSTTEGLDALKHNGPTSGSRPGSPDQRPTRPLDLDIHRAQVAAENIQYIRHLGLSSPHLDQAGESKESSWMYLNLLINMAQLHTINVTPEFVRRAIKKVSTKFEVSKEGQKVRWIGGPEGTVFSKEEEKAIEGVEGGSNGSPNDFTEGTGTGTGTSSKRSKTDSNSNAVISNTTSDDKTGGQHTSSGSKQPTSTVAALGLQSSEHTKKSQLTGSSFDYKPIVFRGRLRDLEEHLLRDSDSSIESNSCTSSDLAHALSRSNLNQQRSADEGLLTFYTTPFFCSDFSGDRMPSNMLHDRDAGPGQVLGLPTSVDPDESALRYGDSCYFAPQFGPQPIQMKVPKLPRLELGSLSTCGEDETCPVEFICSGLGGTSPDDNFAIDVKIARHPATHDQVQELRQIPFTGHVVQAKLRFEVASAHKIDLLPSRLPPPSYIFFTSSSSSGNQDLDDSDNESDDSSSLAEDDYPASPTFLQRRSAESSGDYDDDDDQESSSMDMLAMARAVDPERVAEQERQYMITEPGGRAAAGSLAATVGASRSSESGDGSDTDDNAATSSNGVDMDGRNGDDERK